MRQLIEHHTSLALVSKTFGIAEMTIRNWLVAYQLGGEEALLPKRTGRRRQPRDESDPLVAAVTGLKEEHPEYGARRIRDLVQRLEALGVSATTVQRVLVAAGMVAPPAPGPVERGERPPRRFERAAPNQLWQSDIFTFLLRRHERLYLTAFMDDHSRFLVSFVLAHHQKGSLVLEALERGIAAYGTPQEVLTDQGRQYTAWRGETLFEERLRQYGIRHIKSRPQHPETLGKIERFWKTLWEEFLSRTVFSDFADCQRRLGLFVEGYNFQRPHQALDGLVPADRYFRAAPQVRAAIEKNIEANALRRAQQQPTQKPFYLVGRLGDQDLSIAAEGQGLRVRLGNEEPQTINLQKERPDDEQAPPTRFRTYEEADKAPANATMGAHEHRGRPDGAAPLPAAVERAVGREVGERGGRGDEDLAGRVLPARDPGPGGDVGGAGPGGRERFEQGRSASWEDQSPGGEGEEARARETALGAAASSHAPGGEAWAHEARPWEATREPSAAGAEDGIAELDPDTAARLQRAFDPDEGWRGRADKWERKLTGASAPAGILRPEETDDPVRPQRQEAPDLRTGAGGAYADGGALSDDPRRDEWAAHGERGSEAPRHESQPLPDVGAPCREGGAGVGDSKSSGQARPASPGGRAASGAVAPAEGKRAAEDAQRGGGEAAQPGWGLGAGQDRHAGPQGERGEDEDSEQ
ncbi:MAG TPA: IS481 family transposase [Thermoanaerobaculia bacterium]|nr:IS481 family transposase [Thermoanaerobaculia bacterium]